MMMIGITSIPCWNVKSLLEVLSPIGGNDVELSRHTGRDCRYPEHREVNVDCLPWPLGFGNPCRNDEQNLISTALAGEAPGFLQTRDFA